MQIGLLELVKEGNYVASIPPYGYDKIAPDKKTKTLKPNENAKYVPMIYDWFVNERLSPGKIARRLSTMGVPTLTGKPVWHRGTIIDILQNISYTGQVRWHRRKTAREYEDGKIQKTKRRTNPKDQIIVPGKHPALISVEIFEKAQSLFTRSVPVNINLKVINPLVSFLVCKKCGRPLSYQKYTNPNTRPRFAHKESQVCKMKSVPAELVIEALIQSLENYIKDFEMKISNK